MNKKYGVICGSQGFRVVGGLGESVFVEPVKTPFGLSAPLHKIQINDFEVFFLSRHGEKGYDLAASFVNYRANLLALKMLGVQKIIAWSGPGAIDPEIPIGDILTPGDIIDETKCRTYSFFDGTGLGFIRQNPVFCPCLKDSLVKVINEKQGHCRTDDVYVCTEGPRLETPAEIRKFAMFGSTLVGMTLIPEAFLAKELEMCYAPLCYVTNYAESVRERSYRAGELFEGLLDEQEKNAVESAVEMLPEIAINALIKLNSNIECSCGVSLERYRKSGWTFDFENWRFEKN